MEHAIAPAAPQPIEPRSSMTGLTRLLALGQLALVAVTWKLWTPQSVFPQVPLIRAACDWPGWFDWVCLAVLVASSVALLVVARRGRAGRVASAGLAISLAGFFVLDQHRLQPWAWQFFLLAVLLSLADDTTARRGWRWLVIGIYFWSAVSKLDYTFCHEQGPALLGGLKQAMGLRGIPNRWTEALDVVGSLGIALGEMSVAVLLAWPRARWLGLWTATIMHVALLAALGPFGLNHSLGVLLWNVFFIVQNWLLFRESAASHPSSGESVFVQVPLWLRDIVTWPNSRPNRLALGVIVAAMTWPVLEPFGHCDHWLAWAVYSSRADGSLISASHPSVNGELGGFVGPYFVHEQFFSSKLDISQWSLGVLGVPGHPQARFQIGVALALYDRFDPSDLAMFRWTVASRWTGEGHRATTLYDADEIDAESKSFNFNARPRLTTFALEQKNPSP